MPIQMRENNNLTLLYFKRRWQPVAHAHWGSLTQYLHLILLLKLTYIVWLFPHLCYYLGLTFSSGFIVFPACFLLKSPSKCFEQCCINTVHSCTVQHFSVFLLLLLQCLSMDHKPILKKCIQPPTESCTQYLHNSL